MESSADVRVTLSPNKSFNGFNMSVCVEQEVEWYDEAPMVISSEDLTQWITKAPNKTSMADEIHFCDPALLSEVLQVKQDVFEKFDTQELARARSRANPFETLKSAFFMNRAALKMANIDAAAGFLFTGVDRDPRHKKSKGPYYFADVCAGPGGFTEYVLWRKQWAFKGFGFTLKGVHDFRLYDSLCCSPATFESYYGSADDGNVCDPDNIAHAAERIVRESEGCGVHFMMADGGFSVEGNENWQEILSKQLYTCQCLMALEIVRTHGHFVTKVFDVFTAFSVGLIYLMHQCFEKVAIFKPNSSRPANSERYLICNSLRDSKVVTIVRDYMRTIIKEFWELRKSCDEDNLDIVEIVPLDVMKGCKGFTEYISASNNKLAKRQIGGLQKLSMFCQNVTLVDKRQEDLRQKTLKYWCLPDKMRPATDRTSLDEFLAATVSKPEYLFVQPRIINNISDLQRIISDPSDWHYTQLYCPEEYNSCHLYAAVSSRVYRLQNHKWMRLKNIRLAKGTILFAEMVTENRDDGVERKSLHVIDALRLGDTSLADLPFKERLMLIETYCEAVNFETVSGSKLRIRARPPVELSAISIKSQIRLDLNENKYYTYLPQIISNLEKLPKEYYLVNSILFLKSDATQYFNTSYVLRAQMSLNGNQEDPNAISYDVLINYLKKSSA